MHQENLVSALELFGMKLLPLECYQNPKSCNTKISEMFFP